MTYLHLLSPEGEPFEVIEQRAGALLADGWTFNDAPLRKDTVRIDEVVLSVAPHESNGAIADAETHSEDIPVEVVDENTEAGPQADVNDEPNFVEEPTKPRRKRGED